MQVKNREAGGKRVKGGRKYGYIRRMAAFRKFSVRSRNIRIDDDVSRNATPGIPGVARIYT